MDIFKAKLKKYFFLLAGLYIAIRTLGYILLLIFPELLTIHYSNSSTRTLSANYLIEFTEYLGNLIIIYLLNKDMKELGNRSIPILILTFFYNTAGIVFYLIILFASNYKPTKFKYGANS